MMNAATILLLCWVQPPPSTMTSDLVYCINGCPVPEPTATCEVVTSLLDVGVTVHDNRKTSYKLYEVSPTKSGAATMKRAFAADVEG